jgi:hypothetical protein
MIIRIIDLLKQLFWKQNKYAFNNAKYPKNNESRDPFRYSVNDGREEEREEEQNMMRCETEVEDDVSTIQDDDPPAIPRAHRRKSHLYDEPHVSPKTLASKPSSDTTSYATPPQSAPLNQLLAHHQKYQCEVMIAPSNAQRFPTASLQNAPTVNPYLATSQEPSPAPISMSTLPTQ